jgi:hypothetical protein
VWRVPGDGYSVGVSSLLIFPFIVSQAMSGSLVAFGRASGVGGRGEAAGGESLSFALGCGVAPVVDVGTSFWGCAGTALPTTGKPSQRIAGFL